MASFVDFISVRTEICTNCFLILCSWRHQTFSMFSSRGIMVCFLKKLVFFCTRILYYRLISFRNAMQHNFWFFVSSNFFFLEVVEKSLITSESQIVFSKFFVNCLLMYYFEYCIESALKDLCGACYCTCLLVALRVPEMCFWPAKIRKNIEFFEVRTCHWPGAQTWFRHKWKKLVTASVLLYCVE